MESIRMLKDGERLYIIIENPTEDTNKAALDFISERLGFKTIKEETPEGVLPIEVKPVELPAEEKEEKKEIKEVKIPPISNPKYFVEWYLKYDSLNEETQKKLWETFQKYIRAKIVKIDRNSLRNCKKFLTDYEPMMKEIIEKILKQNGYNNLDSFLKSEGEENIKAAFDACRNAMYQMFDIK